jgi:hypothetical protein
MQLSLAAAALEIFAKEKEGRTFSTAILKSLEVVVVAAGSARVLSVCLFPAVMMERHK